MRYYLPKALTYNLISPDYPAAALANLKSALVAGIGAESDWTSGQAAGPLVRWFEYSHGNIGGGKAWAASQAALLCPGRPSPFFEALDNAVQDGAILVRGSGDSSSLAYVEGDIDDEWKEPGRQLLVVLAGGDVHGVTVYFPIADVEAVCPFSEDEETWETWGTLGASHVPVEINGTWYRSSNVGESGEPLHASQWASYMAGGGAVISVKEFQAIQSAAATPPG